MPAFADWTEAGETQFEQLKMKWVNEINASDLFRPAVLSVLTRTMPYTSEKLIQLLTTYSWFQSQTETIQIGLLDALNKHLKRESSLLNVPIRTVLVKALKK